MNKDEVKTEIEEMDEVLLLNIIECCKQLYIDGTPLFLWDRDTILDAVDRALEN